MKLNPNKYIFGVTSNKFFGYLAYNGGIDANLAKVYAILEMKSPFNKKEVQSLVERLVALSHFIFLVDKQMHSSF